MKEIKLAPKYGAGVDRTPGGKYNNELAVKYTKLLTQIIQETFTSTEITVVDATLLAIGV